MKVADLGSGIGHHTITAARIVGDTGRVYAVDVQEEVLRNLMDTSRAQGLKNVESVWGNIEKQGGTHLKEQSMDAVILSNTLFQLEDRVPAVAEIKRILKSGGRLMVIDWAGSYEGMGPRTEHCVPEHEALSFLSLTAFTS